MSEAVLRLDDRSPRSRWARFWPVLARDKAALVGLALVALVLLLAIIGPYLAPYDVTAQSLTQRRLPPSLAHPFGLDDFGRDILSRVLVGARYTLGVSFIAVSIGLVCGIALGLTAGYLGGWWDAVIMRLVDTMLSFPYLLLAIVIVGALGPGLNNAIIAIGVAAVPTYARVTRGVVLSLKENEYVLAARAVGGRESHIVWGHIMPNAMAPLIVVATVGMAQAALSAAALSFLGLGAQPPMPEWGAMLSGGRAYLFDAPHIATFPGIAIVLSMLGFNLLGDGLRDALDPRLRNVS
ncbi:MAG: ABC transporter permease [Chloroflexota bacterium]